MLNILINIADFLISFTFGLYTFIILFRFFLQLVRIDFYNPICQIVMRITNSIILPIRKIIPSFLNLDLSCIVAVYLIFVIQDLMLSLLHTIGFDLSLIFIKPFIDIVFAIINMYVYLIIIRAISSLFIQGYMNHHIFIIIFQITEPILSILRNIIKPKYGFDLSPIILLILLFCIQIFLQNLIVQLFY